MPSESAAVESRRVAKPGAPQPEQEHLPCPRCDSTNTKFCYYNNYNFSQPRHFCKSCRRYWTHGGTLRDIPVGGGTRKNAKRTRTSAMLGTISNGDHFPLPATPVLVPMTASHGGAMQFGGDDKNGGGGGGGMCGSFTSLLNTQGPAGFLALGGFGLGLAPGFVEDVGFGLGRGVWPFAGMSDAGGAGVVALSGHHGGSGGGGGGIGGAATGLGNTWQYESGEHGFVGGDCFSSWPDLAISTPGNGLK